MSRLHHIGMKGNPTAEVAILGIPQPGCAPFVIGTLGAAFESPVDVQPQITSSDIRLVSELALMLNRQVLTAVDSRSATEFERVRNAMWPKYVRALRALSDTVRNLISEIDIERIAQTVSANLAMDLEKQRGLIFNQTLTDQSIFTVWTLERIRATAYKLDALNPSSEQRTKDMRLNKEYRICSLWAQFHMDMVVASMRYQKTMPEDVQDEVCDGLRAAVNAYAIMEEAMALRSPRAVESAPPATRLPWDEEDEELLAASMRDMNADFAAD